MKALLRGVLLVMGVGLVLGLGVAWARPEWRPSWARFDLEPLWAWMHPGGAADDDDERAGRGEDERGPAEMVDDGWCAARAKLGVATAGPGASDCARLLPVIRLGSPTLARRIGLDTATAVVEPHAHRLECNAETAYDVRRSAEIIPRVAGVLKEVRADLGPAVRKGEVLAVVDSAEVGAAKANYLTAHAEVELALKPA